MIKYKKGFKYQLYEDYSIKVNFLIGHYITTKFIDVYDGKLIIKDAYAWDGCSGPTIDRKTNMRGGLVHDAIAQLIRMKKLPKSYYKKSNILFKEICIEDKMNKVSASFYFNGVDNWLAKRIATGKPKKIYTAP